MGNDNWSDGDAVRQQVAVQIGLLGLMLVLVLTSGSRY
jgi:hypothetical protein